METANQIAQLALAVASIAAMVVAAVQGTRWGRGKAVQHARETLELLQAVAAAAVRATEQESRKAPAAADPRDARAQKLDAATGRFYQLLPPGMSVCVPEARALIERAVHEMNAERLDAALLERAGVDPQ